MRLEVAEDAIEPDRLPVLRSLARVGVSLAVDDFGAGAAALPYVTRVPALEEILFQPVPLLDHGFVRLDNAMADDLSVVNAARVSFAQQVDAMTTREEGLIRFLMRERHGTPFEHNAFRFHIKTPIFVAREADDAAMAEARRAVEDGLDRAHERAYAALGTEDPGAHIRRRPAEQGSAA